jgi:hypothetical protein
MDRLGKANIMEPNIVRISIEGSDLSISFATYDDDHSITAILKDKGEVVGDRYADGSTYEQRQLAETLLRWLIDGKD